MRISTVYALIDPNDKKVRYVGVTNCLVDRHNAHIHIKRKARNEKEKWILELRANGQRPIMKTLIDCPYEERLIHEKLYYEYYAETHKLYQKAPTKKLLK